jgi:hypothetical protein
MQNNFPISLKQLIVKWQSLNIPLVGPQNDASSVKEFIN